MPQPDAADDRRPPERQGHLLGLVLGRLERRAWPGTPDPLFQFHHQPFAYFANYADGTPARPRTCKDETGLPARRCTTTRCRRSSFVKPLGADNEHPGYADLPQRPAARGRPGRAPCRTSPALGRHGDHHHLRRERRLLGPRRPADGRSLGARARASRRSSSRRTPRRASSTTPSTTPPRSCHYREALGPGPVSTRDAAAADLSNAFELQVEATATAAPAATAAPVATTAPVPTAEVQPTEVVPVTGGTGTPGMPSTGRELQPNRRHRPPGAGHRWRAHGYWPRRQETPHCVTCRIDNSGHVKQRGCAMHPLWYANSVSGPWILLPHRVRL